MSLLIAISFGGVLLLVLDLATQPKPLPAPRNDRSGAV
jgi:hypothetical protein